MPRAGRQHRLLIYTLLMDRLAKQVLAGGILLLLLALLPGVFPALLYHYILPITYDPRLWLACALAGVLLMLALLLFILARTASVQPRRDHLQVVTPFLRLSISYRRIRQTTSQEVHQVFPPGRLPAVDVRLINRLPSQTLVLIDLNGYPMPRAVLSLFLSRHYFPDQTPRLALLVPDWMEFSNELESYRTGWQNSIYKQNIAVPKTRAKI